MKINLLTPFCVDQRNSKVSSYRESLVFVAGAKSIDVVFYALYAYRHRFLLFVLSIDVDKTHDHLWYIVIC